MSLVRSVQPLGFPWRTVDPFLFCVHHLDHYPEGDDAMGPAASLAGRSLGMDFGGKDGWSMYHGQVVPGFPRHPHRGFETISIARQGFIDHSDSLGATARFGQGDVQWMTAGAGIVHSEMFPLRQRDRGNPMELFQIWLNLPARKKMVDPHFTMFWSEDVPRPTLTDEAGRKVDLGVIAGALEGHRALAPPPDSWASEDDAHVAIWTLRFDPGARCTLPVAPAGVRRTLYLFRGRAAIDGREVAPGHAIEVEVGEPCVVEAGDAETELLVLQGRPIAEPVAHHGPFVMNDAEGLRQAFRDYQRTQFGGWPWPDDAPVHPRERGRFARHADGRTEER